MVAFLQQPELSKELLKSQKLDAKEIYECYAKEMREAQSTVECIQANNRAIERIGELFLPEQSVFVFRDFFASYGPTRFFGRIDVMKDFEISESQQKKLLMAGSQCADQILQDFESFVRTRVQQTIDVFDSAHKDGAIFAYESEDIAEELIVNEFKMSKFAIPQTNEFYLGEKRNRR